MSDDKSMSDFEKESTLMSEENTLTLGQLGNALASMADGFHDLEKRLSDMMVGINDPNRQKFNNFHFFRNVLPNDSAVSQKMLMTQWRMMQGAERLNYSEILDSGFRVFSQNDEDGIILRIFSSIGFENKFVIEIGSNCAGSQLDIPENLSANLVINHGWHALVLERDLAECKRMQYFFAQNPATKHFHNIQDGQINYYSPRIVCAEVSVDNVSELIPQNAGSPDLLIIDIDSIDYSILHRLDYLKPRVIVVEIEKMFKGNFSVKLKSPEFFNQGMSNSGSTSLGAWVNLLTPRGYYLCALSGTGFNAFFVRDDVSAAKIEPLSMDDAFDKHPIFSKLPVDFWVTPNENWVEV